MTTEQRLLEREIRTTRLSSGYWHIRGVGPCNYSQPPHWPCDLDTLKAHSHPEAGEAFLRRAAKVSELISSGKAPSYDEIWSVYGDDTARHHR